MAGYEADGYRRVVPVVGGKMSKDGKALIFGNILGTAFPIGGNFWMTAAHVIEAAVTYPIQAIASASSGELWIAPPIFDCEEHKSHDIAVFRTEPVPCTSVTWMDHELALLQPVYAIGYPYALNVELKRVVLRGFSGHVVSAGPSMLPTDRLPARPRVYELQFQAPRGLSGAPLMLGDLVVGVIVANASSEIQVLVSRETEKEITTGGEKTIIHERSEMLHLGVAVQSTAILPLRFGVLGKTVGEHLASNGLLRATGTNA